MRDLSSMFLTAASCLQDKRKEQLIELRRINPTLPAQMDNISPDPQVNFTNLRSPNPSPSLAKESKERNGNDNNQ